MLNSCDSLDLFVLLPVHRFEFALDDEPFGHSSDEVTSQDEIVDFFGSEGGWLGV